MKVQIRVEIVLDDDNMWASLAYGEERCIIVNEEAGSLTMLNLCPLEAPVRA